MDFSFNQQPQGKINLKMNFSQPFPVLVNQRLRLGIGTPLTDIFSE
jgi:hypothetical protein